jgi:hypothetical protein
MKVNKVIKATALGATLALGLSSCMTASGYYSHKDLVVESKMSNTVYFNPPKDGHKIIFVEIRNTTKEDLSGFTKLVDDKLEKGGWIITDNMDNAYYQLRVNILQAGAVKSPAEANSFINQGAGSIAGGAMVGTIVGLAGSGLASAGIAGIAVAGTDYALQQVIKDKAYSVVTDIQVGEKLDGTTVQKTSKSVISNGTTGSTDQFFKQDSNWHTELVRIGSVADQVNLEFKDAIPVLKEDLADEIAGIFVVENGKV